MAEGQRDVVLIVDDSPGTLGVLTEAIERAGATVLVAVAGDLALTLLDEITPDIILMDALMPGMDGFETCRRLKARSALAHVPVIFMTGLSETEHIVRGLEAGGVDYVTKPADPDEVLARIRVHLASARAAQSARAALDTTGRILFAVDRAGAILWCTPQAARLLGSFAPDSDAVMSLPASALAWLRECLGGAPIAPLPLSAPDGRTYALGFIGGAGNEILLRLAPDSLDAGIERLRTRLRITGREAEVLLWLSRGKSSRDIGEILGLSPRTVMKHLEGIYAKLGVENRTAASLVAARHLEDLS